VNEKVEIRPATTNDIETIERLAREIWPATYSDILTPEQLNYMLDYFYNPAALESQMTRLNHHFIMSLLGDRPVGFASWSRINDQGIYKLHKLYVHNSTQGKGIGRKMVEYILEKLQGDGAAELRLNVNRYNKARFFYEKIGFTIIGEEDVDLGNGVYQEDYVMQRPVMLPA
jgi:ribosomal protein S18 acetylase RimI-like enzyme